MPRRSVLTTCAFCAAPLAGGEQSACPDCCRDAVELRRLAERDEDRASVEAARNPLYAAFLATRAIERRRLARQRDGE